ncbi:unextended protein isoform X2 [Phlebotomus argentipes]|uniref:unextended protein isoform X2 n=1 Tax=Phlebotomus argentipes TaxID=94469 RepID=UPI002892C630|nr:unextended protein isoform X2 [Phlebotomus argentipes]
MRFSASSRVFLRTRRESARERFWTFLWVGAALLGATVAEGDGVRGLESGEKGAVPDWPLAVSYVRKVRTPREHLSEEEGPFLRVAGRGFSTLDGTLKLTASPDECQIDGEALQILTVSDSSLLARYPSTAGQFDHFLCVHPRQNHSGVPRHLGPKSRIHKMHISPPALRRSPRDAKLDDGAERERTQQSVDAVAQPMASMGIRIDGFRVEHADKEPRMSDDGTPELMSETEVHLRLFGSGLRENMEIVLTSQANMYGGSCLVTSSEAFPVVPGSVGNRTALVRIIVPHVSGNLYFCAKESHNGSASELAIQAAPFVHQGTDKWMRLRSYEKLLPVWVSLIIIGVCLMFSALFSGLNLGLMSLDRTELKILRNTGTEKEKRYASQIQPVRDHGNYLLCSILLGNVLVNSTFTILLDGLTSGLVAVICSTIAIVIFGEITPQAICSRHGLAVGAKTIYITRAVMLLTWPLSYPTSKILDLLLGEEIGNVYNRERLKELVRVTKDINDLDKDEVNIISGALELRKKTVGDVMTHIEDAFMLSLDAVLGFETVSEIMKSGFSRIPVYEGERTNIVTLLYIKDLAFVDPDDNTPLKTLCEFYENSCHFVFDDVTLDVMFKQFKEGNKGHMAFVHRVNSEGDGDPFYETIGLVTLEDVIEEMIQAEIMDETDVFTDNRTKVRRNKTKKQDFTVFAERRENHRIRISPQLTLATFQYLSTSVDAFKADLVSETILRRLLNQDIINHIKCKGKERTDPSISIYQQGKPVDFFVLILEGRVEVTVGKENLVFESGPFTYFGTQALVQNVGVVDSPQQIMGSLQSLNMDAMLRHTFVPDYSVRAVTEVVYIAIRRTLYLAAKRATLMERSQKFGDQSSDAIDDEVQKLLHSLDEDDRSIGADTANLMVNTPKMMSKPPSKSPSPTPIAVELAMKSAGLNSSATVNSIGLNNGGSSARSHSIPNQNFKMIGNDPTQTPLLPRSKS